MLRQAIRLFPAMRLVFPETMAEVAPALPLLRAEKAEFEAVFGIEVLFVEHDPGDGPRWIIQMEPDRETNALSWDRDTLVLISRAKNADGLMTTFNLVHSLIALGVDEITDAPHVSMADAVQRIQQEVAASFPGFGIRGLDRDGITARHVVGDGSGMTFEDAQRWIAELGDAHTAIRRPVPIYNPPYVVALTPQAAKIHRIPEESAAWHAGVRPGWTLEVEDPAGWLARTGAPPHSRPFTAGRRAIALEGIQERDFVAISPAGDSVSWTERANPPELGSIFSFTRINADTGLIRLFNWFTGLGVEEALDDALTEMRDMHHLILDLRGNTGGNLVLAMETRRRFLHERTMLGSIRFSRGDGILADPVELWDEPSADRVCWGGKLIVLTDALTYSASEDFLLGLQGLPHVTVIGQRSGGGSGRARTLGVLEDMCITISTALTYDRNGICIENHGIPVDIDAPVFAVNGRDAAMDRAIGCIVERRQDGVFGQQPA